ncbi:ferritin-like domain-containing protein [Actinomadura opuntiae]|uniref:ferritin-like domain-containing protein n=1 Tax=Actinomadura sp. OS1-43 TaxID=604315 RepID=UPI00255B1CBB|nr:ferritin-like protein [Actinomadura sp. OS1-43]MDL4817495.1 ferritin-like protein [Actinomadura sp. OS1-43]
MTTETAPTASASLAAVLDAHPVDAAEGVRTRGDLVNHLQQAAAVELQTIPMYLYAMYSIGGVGTSRWNPGMSAQRLIRSIVIEEMLHLCLVRNILVALGAGDQVTFYSETFIPDYPEYMLHRHPPLLLHAAPCTKEVVRDVFMQFERPYADPKEGKPPKGQYTTIGLFYEAIKKGLKDLNSQDLWAAPHKELQYVAAYWNKDGGGSPLAVENLATAQTALKMIVEQGEGADPKKPSVSIDPLKPKLGMDELPHYTKFQRIAEGVEAIGPVWKVPTDPKWFQYADDEAAAAVNDLFNAVYCYVLHFIDVLYRTPSAAVDARGRSLRYGYERTFVSAMQGLLANIAEIMVARPVQAGPLARDRSGDDTQIGPTFEYVELPESGRRKHLVDLCDKAARHFPALGGDNSVRWLLDKMPDL